MPKPSSDLGAVTDPQHLSGQLAAQRAAKKLNEDLVLRPRGIKIGIKIPTRLPSALREVKPDLTAFTKMGHRVAEQIERKILGTPTTHVGIDPGASGGMAWVGNHFEHDAETVSLKHLTDKQTWEWFSAPGPFGEERPRVDFAVIEANTGYVGGGGNPGSAMFKFGVSTGKLLGFLTAAGIPFEAVAPRTWQKALGIAPRRKGKKQKVAITKGKHKGLMRVKEVGGESKAEFKKRLLQFAQRLFPSLEITLATADALLIAEFCRRKREGSLT